MRRASKSDVLWWTGVPVLLFLSIFGPFWVRNLLMGEGAWWRIVALYGVVFDVTAYLQPIGQVVRGLPTASLLGPFAQLIRGLGGLFPSASISEIWLISRWMTEVAALWMSAWVAERLASVSKNHARLFSVSMWLSFVVVLGMKPGVFSWFLPCGAFGVGAVLLTQQKLKESRYVRAFLWSLAGLVFSSVYAWYFLVIVLWMGCVWLEWLIKRSLRSAVFVMVITVVVATACAMAASIWISESLAGILWLQLYERLSLSYTHFLFLSTSMLLSVAWCLLTGSLARDGGQGVWGERIKTAFTGWVCVVLAFALSPFTGLFILNDHFRAPAAILSWFTLALCWQFTRVNTALVDIEKRRNRSRWIPGVTIIGSGVFIVRILSAPYAWNGDTLNVVLLSHWMALFFAASLIMYWKMGYVLSPRKFFSGVFLVVGCTTAVALTYVYTKEFAGMDRLKEIYPVFSWVDKRVPITDAVCAGHGGEGYSLDDALSAHTGRVVHMAHTTLYHHEPNEAYLDRMRVLAGFYDVRAAGDEPYWQLQSSLNQFIVCSNFPVQRKILTAMHISAERINKIIGCPQKVIDARWVYVKERIDKPVSDVEAFQKMCPWVVTSERAKSYWHLPSVYQEYRISDGWLAYSFKQD